VGAHYGARGPYFGAAAWDSRLGTGESGGLGRSLNPVALATKLALENPDREGAGFLG